MSAHSPHSAKTNLPTLEATFDDHAVAIAKRQYFQESDTSLAAMFERVANWVATPEHDTHAPQKQAEARQRFFDLMAKKRFCPGGRVLAGAATNHGNVLNCFVQDGSPEREGTTDWVLHLARKLALVTKVGGGNGVNLDPLPAKRPYTQKVGTLYISINADHADFAKVRDGRYMDLVRGEYVTKGYRFAQYLEQPLQQDNIIVGDSVEGIWQAANQAVRQLLEGQDVVLDLSELRPEGTPVLGSGGNSSGPSSFAVEVFDNFGYWASLGGAEYAGAIATLRYVFAPTLRVIRQGGCLHPDTLVHTDKGTLRLRELVDTYHYGWQEHQLKVATDEGWKDSMQSYNNGNANTLKVLLANGQQLQGTANHKLKVMRADGQREWVRLEQLQPDDYIIQVLDQHTGSPVTLSPLDEANLHHNTKTIATPEVLSERVAFFLGYLWGDGFISDNRIGYAVAHGSPMMAETPKLFAELFGLEVRQEQKDNDKSMTFVTRSRALTDWLAQNGLHKGKAPSLSLPRAIRQAPRPVVAAFLRGLFEADGSIDAGYASLSSASKQLLEDVAVMLAGLGIPSRLRRIESSPARYSDKPRFHLKVCSSMGHQRFNERIGWLENSRFAALAEFTPDEARESSWVLPHATALLQETFAALPAGKKGNPSPYTQARKTLSRYIRGERNLTATSYSRLRSDTLLADKLPDFPHDEYYVKVKEVKEAGRILTLDLSVAENKTYLANGFVSHNTRRGAGMATMSVTHPDIHDFITCKDLEREQSEGDISTFNISVLVDDAFMQEQSDSQILRDIAEHAWQTGEPGLIFIDRINEHNAMRQSLGDIKSTNPCVTADTWVQTHMGARQVRDMLAQGFCSSLEGKQYRASSFWSTGVKPVFNVTTKRGYTLRLTANHQLKKVTKETRYAQESTWQKLEDFQIGDTLVLSNQRQIQPWAGTDTFAEGWLLGMLVGDGTFDNNRERAHLDFWGDEREVLAQRATVFLKKLAVADDVRIWRSDSADKIRLSSPELAKLAYSYGIEHGNKGITDAIEQASYFFYQGFLAGLFDADGSVQGTQDKGVSIRLAQSNLELLQRAQRMLARLGIMTTLYQNRRSAGERLMPDGQGGSKLYAHKAQHELVISGDNLAEYADMVSFEHPQKVDKLRQSLENYQRQLNRERFSDEIISIDAWGEEEVFDVSVEKIHAFDANGILAHNCGEIPLYAGEPCDLGAMNLSAYVRPVSEGIAKGMEQFNFNTFADDVQTCIRFLDNVLEVNKFALEDNRVMSQRLRRLGLGVMGLADALIKMGYRYDSSAGRAAVETIIAALRDNAHYASQELANERGTFPDFEQSGLLEKRRNIALLTVAPTGTTSMLMGVSSGVEPIFAPFIYRKIGDSYAALISPLFQELLEQHPAPSAYQKDSSWDWDKVVEKVSANHGSVQGLDFIPEAVKAVLVCAHDISPEDHVRMQGVVQRTFDGDGHKLANSISKTINMPNSASVDDVFAAYKLAYKQGCKGITVYRDGSRQFQVLSTSKENSDDTNEQNDNAKATASATSTQVSQQVSQSIKPRFDRPARLTGFTDAVKLTMPTGEKRGFYVTVNKQNDIPSEVFIISGKAGDEANADAEALGRLTSIALQYGVPAEAIVKTLRGINGGMYGSYQGRMVGSKADIIAIALETAGVVNPDNLGAICPECDAPLRFEEGCQKCESCGYSKCG